MKTNKLHFGIGVPWRSIQAGDVRSITGFFFGQPGLENLALHFLVAAALSTHKQGRSSQLIAGVDGLTNEL